MIRCLPFPTPPILLGHGRCQTVRSHQAYDLDCHAFSDHCSNYIRIFRHGAYGTVDVSQVESLNAALRENINQSPLRLIPPIFIVLMVIFKIPAIPGLLFGVVLGVLCSGIFQGQDMVAVSVYNLYEGFVSETGNEFLDTLLTRGGIESMFYAISIVFAAMFLGGILEASNVLRTLCEAMLKFAKGTGSLVTIVVISCIVINITCADQYVAIVLPGKMYKQEFEDRRLRHKTFHVSSRMPAPLHLHWYHGALAELT